MIAPLPLSPEYPSFDVLLPELNQFILDLVEGYNAAEITSWEALEEKANAFFTPEMMDHIDSIVPHWRKMASYEGGVTLVHVMCVFMGLYRMPEFLAMPAQQQGLMKWIILFHDLEKELLDGKRDYAHAYRSTAGAAHTLPKFGFPTTTDYSSLIDPWSEFTRSAVTLPEGSFTLIQDNRKLPEIVGGIERMFGQDTPATLILKTILFHLAIGGNEWPSPSPLTKEEIKRYFDRDLLSLSLVMNLGDNDGWNLFKPAAWERGRMDTLGIFERLGHLISESFHSKHR